MVKRKADAVRLIPPRRRAKPRSAADAFDAVLRCRFTRETLLSYLHACDIYVLRRVVPRAPLSVRAVERERSLVAGSARGRVARRALGDFARERLLPH